ncbi:CHASE3 domain-containing protein [Lichenicoccus sp.]|uniref:CHASE3 domain-containing protein n=1 Tax=Lichenicoccus sp. TaxID=2781899 RepID=UPI003D0BA721
MSRYVIARANLVGFAALAALLLLIGGMTWDRLVAVRVGNQWVQHTDQVLVTIKDLQIGIRALEDGQRGYLLTGENDYLLPYNTARGRVGTLLAALRTLTADNPTEQDRLRLLAPLLAHKVAFTAQTVATRRDGGVDAALAMMRTDLGRQDMLRIDGLLGAMTGEEQKLLGQRLTANARREDWLGAFAVGAALLVALAMAWAARMLNAAWSRSARMEVQQRALAERLRASLDSLSQGVAVFDAQRLLTNWNPCFAALLSLPNSFLREGMPYSQITGWFSDPSEHDLLESDAQIERSGVHASGEVVTYERTRADGQHLELRRTGMSNSGFVLTISDMTKRMQAEAVLREAQKMQAIGQLTGGIAHDFNNLLTVILGNLELTQKRLPADHALQTRLARAVWASQRGAALTAQLLAFARKQPLAPAPLDLAASLPEIVPLLQRTLGAPIEVRFVGAAGLWPAMADAAQLESAVLNLALNARDAMPGGGRLTLELANKVIDQEYADRHAEVLPGDYVMVAVSDSGHGMSAEVVARAFEPFYTTKPEGKGTGLGLAMVFGFVKQSKGHVKIYSEPGEGTSIKIYLPRAIGGLGAAPSRTQAPMPLVRGEATVLLVEDEPGVREIAASILRDYGYRVLEAADGEEALRVFGAHTSDINLLLTDVVLPGTLRGRDIAERVTALRPEVGVLFMSGYTENSIVHHGRLDDGVHLIGKPFKREQFAAKVAAVLNAAPRTAANDEHTNLAG